MSIEGNTSNLRAPEERNVYSGVLQYADSDRIGEYLCLKHTQPYREASTDTRYIALASPCDRSAEFIAG